MVPYPAVNNLIVICIDTILRSQISPEAHIVVIGTKIKLNYPQISIDEETELETEPLLRKPDVYIADLEEISLNKTITIFQEKTTFNPRAQFIFLTVNIKDENMALFSKIFISNVIFIDVVSGDISTYYPYNNYSLHEFNHEIITINKCSNFNGHKNKDNILFEDKIPKLWNNALVKLCHLYEPPYSIGPDNEYKGLNLDIFNLIASLIQLEPVWNLLTMEDGDLTTYSKESVKNNEVCDLNMELYPVDGADFVHPHVFDDILIFVPAPLQIPRWKYLFKTLTIEIWIFWIFTSLILSFFWFLILLVLEKRWEHFMMLEVLWLNVEFFIERSHDVAKNYLSLKLLYFLVILQSFLLNMIFKCNFNLVLSGIIFEKSIQTLQEIADKNLVFGLFQLEEFENFLESIKEGRERVKYAECGSNYSCFSRVAFDRDMALHQSIRIYRYIQNNYLDKDGTPLIVKLDPPFEKVGLFAILPLGHPLKSILDEYILKLQAYGFTKFFIDKYDHEIEKNLPFQLQLSKLTFEHVYTPSALLIGGYILGFVVFIFEMRRNCIRGKN